MFKVTVNNEEDMKIIPIMEYALIESHKKLIGARMMYGDNLIDYLINTDQFDMLMDAMGGKLDHKSITIDEGAYSRIYGVDLK